MKRTAIDHHKIHELAFELNLYERSPFLDPVTCVTGILERLWLYTSKNIKDGGIGRMRNEAIASVVGWPIAHADELIQALVKIRWLDEDERCRLYVHDWHDHCEDSIHIDLARGKMYFANGMIPSLSRLGGDERKRIEEFYAASSEKSVCNEDTEIAAHSVRTKSAQKAHGVRTSPCPSPSPSPLKKDRDEKIEKKNISPTGDPPAACPPPQAGFGPECDSAPADTGEGREMPDPDPPMEDFHSPESGFAPESSLETEPGPGAEPDPAPGPDPAPPPKPTVDIQAIYQAYPRHEGSRAALRKIESAVKTLAREERIPLLDAGTRLLDITREYAQSPRVQDLRDRLQRTGENFIPMPSTWFGQDRWRDGKQAWGYGLPTPTPSNRGQPVYACELDRTHLPVEEFL